MRSTAFHIVTGLAAGLLLLTVVVTGYPALAQTGVNLTTNGSGSPEIALPDPLTPEAAQDGSPSKQ